MPVSSSSSSARSLGFAFRKAANCPQGKQHRAGEAAIVEAGKRRGLLQLVRDFIGEDFAVSAARQLDAGRLQIAIRLVTGPVLAPESAVGDAFYFKLDLRQTLGGIAGHQVVLRLGDLVQARRLMIERRANGIEQRGFPGPGGAGNGEQAIAGERLGGKVYLPFPFQGVEVFRRRLRIFMRFHPPR